ncbi:hypothetical protein [Bdellovibrio sp. HCB337]|uniref:hypothetical protein n=1 Tax=Bdellovibrio sp. HCB337 TaxID=3394358 RepID=UPI0039A6BD48
MKNKIFVPMFVFGLSIILPATFVAAAEVQPIHLEKLDENTDFQIGCSCAISNKLGEYLVFSEPEANAPAIVRIDGVKKELKAVSSTQKSRTPRLGDRFYKTYSLGKIKMRVNYNTTFVCSAPDNSCEVTRYSVDIRLEEGKRKNVLTDLLGECGC